MTKILLVEDDNNLREIYQARLAAEGYEIVAAEDGEAALALASKERPQLIITDVMMPKISGFEMLDILRNTDALRDVKVIMLTALSQAEDNARAGKLGADRYLVKSQVTLEDIVKAAHDLLDGTPADAASPVAAAAIIADVPVVAAPASIAEPDPVPAPVIDLAVPPATQDSDQAVVDLPASPSIGTNTATDDTTVASDAPAITVVPPDAPEPDAAEAELTNAQTSSQEESALENQISQFLTDTDKAPAPEAAAPDTVASDLGGQNLVSDPPTDESEDEYAKDDGAPDMGNLSVQDVSTTPATEEPSEPGETAAAPASEPPVEMELPAPVEPQQAGDQVVSSAIDSMMAQGQTSADVTAPIMGAPSGEPELDPSDVPAATPRPIAPPESPSATSDAPLVDAQTTRIPKKTISPIDHGDKPDIHQLLSLEEAKNGAVQAAQVTTGPTPVTDAPAAAPVDGVDPSQVVTMPEPPKANNGLDPNAVAL